MYLNAYQKYVEELIGEYESLLLSQLLKAVNHKFGIELPSIEDYARQMCYYGNYKMLAYGSDYILHVKGGEPNYDMIRSFDVVLSFFPQVAWHRKSRKPISICFFVNTLEHDREISVIPVQQGNERMLARYADDKFEDQKCEVVIFLLETKEQMKLISSTCNYRFALITRDGVMFYKKDAQ